MDYNADSNKSILEKTNKELYDIYSKMNDYQSDFIENVRNELIKRNPERFNDFDCKLEKIFDLLPRKVNSKDGVKVLSIESPCKLIIKGHSEVLLDVTIPRYKKIIRYSAIIAILFVSSLAKAILGNIGFWGWTILGFAYFYFFKKNTFIIKIDIESGFDVDEKKSSFIFHVIFNNQPYYVKVASLYHFVTIHRYLKKLKL
jgi:hypothetical protein